jgi:uncharacterized iron-regulated membrane protein
VNTFRFFWNTHRWVGISAAAFLLLIASTGFLLLLKKEYAWIQPPTQVGTAGTLESFLTLEEAWQRVLATKHPDFRTFADLDRIDVRPDKRVYKVRSKHNHTEIQLDAINGEILSSATRRSDFLEELHDGSWFAKPIHDYLMPIVAICVVFLVCSGLGIWLTPILKRRRNKRDRALNQKSAG